MLDKKPIVCPNCETVYGVYVCAIERLPCVMVKTCPLTVLTKLKGD